VNLHLLFLVLLVAAPVAGAAPVPPIPLPSPEIWLTFGLDRFESLQVVPFAGIPLWQYLSSLIYILLAFYLSKGLDALVAGRLKKWAEQTTTEFDDLLLELVRGPVKVISFVVLLHMGMGIYSWPEALETYISKGLKIIVGVSITYLVVKLVDLWIGLLHQRATERDNEQFGRELLPLISKTVKAFVIIVATLVISQNLGFNVTGLIASLSIGGIAVGLAAQDTLANVFGAVAILVDRPFKVGDRIQLDKVDGTVEAIGFRSTRVRNLDGHLVVIPNKTMGSATITNVTARPTIKTEMNIGLTYDTPAERLQRAVQIIEDIFKPHPHTADLLISFDKFERSSLNVLVVHWSSACDYKEYLAGLQQMNLELKRRFDAEGIRFAFPTQTIHLRQDSAGRLAGAETTATTARKE
jgi:MscS family membrane protein